jgi:hypothetical protein
MTISGTSGGDTASLYLCILLQLPLTSVNQSYVIATNLDRNKYLYEQSGFTPKKQDLIWR